ncbi:MAG TPA: hypothetical protein VFC39_13710 [Acidobacteriaceae bacterium]|nr:hypothetical protein [Acidobacteriaceae bacterium]
MLGLLLLIADIVLYAVAEVRTPKIDPTSTEFFLYFWGGILLAAISLLLLLFGRGKKRWIPSIAGIVILYLWISYVGLEVMKH